MRNFRRSKKREQKINKGKIGNRRGTKKNNSGADRPPTKPKAMKKITRMVKNAMNP